MRCYNAGVMALLDNVHTHQVSWAVAVVVAVPIVYGLSGTHTSRGCDNVIAFFE